MSIKLPISYYQGSDVVALSQDLLGKYLMTEIDGTLTGGMITETEAYRGVDDRASHAFNERRTKRNEMMYADGGCAYVYLCYGIHALFNIVTHQKNVPHAILIRAVMPKVGVEVMRKRRHGKKLVTGPGTLTEALGITLNHNGSLLDRPPIWLEDRGICPKEIKALPRVGIDYAGEDAKLPWRFIMEGCSP